MNFLEKKILSDGVIKEGNILKVSSFLNHQVDTELTEQIAEEFAKRFEHCDITKVVTIEASGIPMATLTALRFGVPMLIAKKSESVTIDSNLFVAEAYSFTHKKISRLHIDRSFLLPTDKVLIIDDFLSEGAACEALLDIISQAGASVVGIGIAIEKGYRGGGKMLRAKGHNVESIAIIDSMNAETKVITFK